MQTNNILSAPLIDIIFDGRNKDYGAYELRAHYHKRIRKALFITMFLASLVFGSMVLAGSFKKTDPNYRIHDGVILKDVTEEKKPEKLPEEKKVKPKEPEVKTVRLTEPEIVEEPESPPPSIDEQKDSKIDIDPNDGVVYEGIVDPGPGDLDGNKNIIAEKKAEPQEPLSIVEIDARFDGNWKAFLERNLNADVPVNNAAPAGRYSVVIRFVVDVDGTVSEITPLTSHGYGLEEEAVRVIRKTKKWEPAFQNGIHVKAYKKQVIVFEVMEE